MYYKINIDRLPNRVIKWSVVFGNEDSSDTDEVLMLGVVKECVSRLKALEQMNQGTEQSCIK